MDLKGEHRGDEYVHNTMYEILEELIKNVSIKATGAQPITATEV